jgi:hypothetical protein
MKLVRVGDLPADAVAAAAEFYAQVLPGIIPPSVGEDLVIIFPPADNSHRAWRLAAVQSLARRLAPLRVNALASDDEAAITAATDYLVQAPGVTGQYLVLDGAGAGGAI